MAAQGRRHPTRPVAALIALTWLALGAGCGPSGVEGESDGKEGWELSDATANGEWLNAAPGGDAGWSNDSPSGEAADTGSGGDLWLEEADLGTGSLQDVGLRKDAAAAEPLERHMIGRWLTVVPLQILPRTTGVVVALKFAADGGVTVASQGTRVGRWRLLPSRKIYLSGLELPEAWGADEMLLTAEIGDGQLQALAWAVDGQRNVRFERPAAGFNLTIESLRGRWQSTAKVSNGSEEFYLGMEVGADDLVTHGPVSPQNALVPLTSHLGEMLTSSTGEHFWLLQPPSPQTLPPVGGEVVLGVDGSPSSLFVPFEKQGGLSGRVVFQSVELVRVVAFGPR